jgi:UrcA family protein
MMFRAICAAFAVLLTIPAAALAGEPTPPPSERVAYGDLDLGADAGAVAMLTRINRAATAVCSRQAQAGSTADVMARFEACHREAVARAVAQLGAPSVLAAYEARPTRQG